MLIGFVYFSKYRKEDTLEVKVTETHRVGIVVTLPVNRESN